MRVSASGLKLLASCAWPFRDDAPEPPREKKHKRTVAGSALHLLNEWALRGELGRTRFRQDAIIQFKVPSSEVERVFAMHERWMEWWRSVGCPPFTPELAFEYNTNTGDARPLPGVSERNYPNEPGCVYGTADCVLVDGCPAWVADAKTGQPMYVDRTRDNHQMLFLSMCVSKVYGVDAVRATLQFIDEEGVTNDDAEYDWLRLEDYEMWLRDRVRQIPGSQPTAGGWCQSAWCKYRPVNGFEGCPAWAEQRETA